jgi:16S rRNA (guanine527-N7)-methyltransferase
MEALLHYFPNLTAKQQKQFDQLHALYTDWNQQINVISRKDMDEFYERHVLHSLAIAKVMGFKPGSAVLDIGTGGGFPGIPLAILFPEVEFTLVDSIGKKIKVVQEVTNALQLTNVKSYHMRAEDLKQQFDFIVSRAVTAMPKFLSWVKGKFKKKQLNSLPNGILYLKGGDLTEEMSPIKNYYEMHPISTFFKENFFETKYVVYVQPL